MIRIDSSKESVVLRWTDLGRPFFIAKHRPVHAVPLYLGLMPLELCGKNRQMPLVAVLATKDGEPDCREGIAIVMHTEIIPSVFDCMVQVIQLAKSEGIIEAANAAKALREIASMRTIQN